MKKTGIVALALALCLSTTQMALAEDESDDFLTWFLGGLSEATEHVASGLDALGEQISTGFSAFGDMIGTWSCEVDRYIQEHRQDESIQDALQALEKSAGDGSEEARKAAEEAYQSLTAWMAEAGETLDGTFKTAVDSLAASCGVARAKFQVFLSEVDAYLQEHREEMTEAVEKAWDTITRTSQEAGEAAKQHLDAAYDTVRAWLQEQGAEEATEALDGMEQAR
ncbi:MAG: hypothetical protein IJ083_00355 [Clostridia bacterium]|nr:hypothetical protein [Clostridia bacterium]